DLFPVNNGVALQGSDLSVQTLNGRICARHVCNRGRFVLEVGKGNPLPPDVSGDRINLKGEVSELLQHRSYIVLLWQRSHVHRRYERGGSSHCIRFWFFF